MSVLIGVGLLSAGWGGIVGCSPASNHWTGVGIAIVDLRRHWGHRCCCDGGVRRGGHSRRRALTRAIAYSVGVVVVDGRSAGGWYCWLRSNGYILSDGALVTTSLVGTNGSSGVVCTGLPAVAAVVIIVVAATVVVVIVVATIVRIATAATVAAGIHSCCYSWHPACRRSPGQVDCRRPPTRCVVEGSGVGDCHSHIIAKPSS